MDISNKYKYNIIHNYIDAVLYYNKFIYINKLNFQYFFKINLNLASFKLNLLNYIANNKNKIYSTLHFINKTYFVYNLLFLKHILQLHNFFVSETVFNIGIIPVSNNSFLKKEYNMLISNSFYELWKSNTYIKKEDFIDLTWNNILNMLKSNLSSNEKNKSKLYIKNKTLYLYKKKIINFFIKRGLRNKAILIWFSIIRTLRYKLLAFNDNNSLNYITLEDILFRALSNLEPIVVLYFKNSSLLNNRIIPRMKLKHETKKNTFSFHKKQAVNWLLQATYKNKGKYLKTKTIITFSDELATEIWNTAFFSNSKSLNLKKNFYKCFFKSINL